MALDTLKIFAFGMLISLILPLLVSGMIFGTLVLYGGQRSWAVVYNDLLSCNYITTLPPLR